MYNDRHWLTDGSWCRNRYFMYQNRLLVVSKMQKLLFKKNKTSVMIAPYYNGKEAGID
jgi:hypothetical protein